MLFANDLSLSVSSEITVVQYADDTQLFVSGRKQNIQHLITSMEQALKCLYQFYGSCGTTQQLRRVQKLLKSASVSSLVSTVAITSPDHFSCSSG